MTNINHNKLIASAAKSTLGLLGLKRDGGSRLWYDDHGWWCIVVEFQPSSWSKGTYLNVGVSWLLYESPEWTFDIGYREHGLVLADNIEQFSAKLNHVVELAVQNVETYRQRFSQLSDVYEYYQSCALTEPWGFYYAGVIAALLGNAPIAQKRFDELLAIPHTYQWQQGLYFRALELSRMLSNRAWLLDSIRGIVLRTRATRSLDKFSPTGLGLPDF